MPSRNGKFDITIQTALGHPCFWTSAKSRRNIGFAGFSTSECDAHQIDGTAAVIVVTESSAAKDLYEAANILAWLRIKEFHVTIDDFGIEYTTVIQLSPLPFSELQMNALETAKKLKNWARIGIPIVLIPLCEREIRSVATIGKGL